MPFLHNDCITVKFLVHPHLQARLSFRILDCYISFCYQHFSFFASPVLLLLLSSYLKCDDGPSSFLALSPQFLDLFGSILPWQVQQSFLPEKQIMCGHASRTTFRNLTIKNHFQLRFLSPQYYAVQLASFLHSTMQFYWLPFSLVLCNSTGFLSPQL